MTLPELSVLLRARRGDRSLREVGRQTGVSAIALSRIERGATPSLTNFSRLCNWLDADPRDLMDIGPARSPDERLAAELDEAESKAWASLRRYKFQMFGYWAAIWVHLNLIGGFRRPNPWRGLVEYARGVEDNNS